MSRTVWAKAFLVRRATAFDGTRPSVVVCLRRAQSREPAQVNLHSPLSLIIIVLRLPADDLFGTGKRACGPRRRSLAGGGGTLFPADPVCRRGRGRSAKACRRQGRGCRLRGDRFRTQQSAGAGRRGNAVPRRP